MEESAIDMDDVSTWHEPGVHQVDLHGRTVWVRVDDRGIAAMSSTRDGLEPAPLRASRHP